MIEERQIESKEAGKKLLSQRGRRSDVNNLSAGTQMGVFRHKACFGT